MVHVLEPVSVRARVPVTELPEIVSVTWSVALASVQVAKIWHLVTLFVHVVQSVSPVMLFVYPISTLYPDASPGSAAMRTGIEGLNV